MHKKPFYDRKTLQPHARDYQFGYTILKNRASSIVPPKNLICNIGVVGTHSKSDTSIQKMRANEKYEIKRELKFVIAERI